MTGARIRALREALAFDHYQFARLMGVHFSSVYRWETAGKAPVEGPSAELLKALLGLPPATIKRMARPLRHAVVESWLAGMAVVVAHLHRRK